MRKLVSLIVATMTAASLASVQTAPVSADEPDPLGAEPVASAYADDIVDLRGDWKFEVYRKYSNMFQYFNFGGIDVTWEDPDAAQLPTAAEFADWETVAVPSPDYSTGGLLQMVRPGSGEVQDDRTALTDFDMFPKWSEAWFARTIEIPDGFLDGGDDVTLLLGIIDDLDVVYVNGTPVGAKGFKTPDGIAAPPQNVPATGGFDADGDFQFEKSYWEVPREYEVDAGLLHEGNNELTIRLYNNNSFGGFYDRPMALAATRDAVRFLKDMPTERLTVSTAYETVIDAQIAAIESEDPVAYGATLDYAYVEDELDKGEQIAAMQKIFDEFDDLKVDDVDGGFYRYRGSPVYSAERVITGTANGERAVVRSNDQHLQYFVSTMGVVLERGNMSHTYAVDYVSELDEMQGATLRYNVYLPPSYYSEPDRSFPVVYLLHGINSTGDSFVNVDRIEQRMNEWIEDGSITEMIVVMPNSGKSSGYTDTPAPNGPNDSQGPWASHIYIDILDQIESNYRAIPDARFRALTGISMGGGGVFKIGLEHTDIYTSFASHMGAIPDLSAYTDELDSEILPSLDFYIDHGLQDEMVNPAVSERAGDYLGSIGANLEFELREGGHNSAFYMAGMPQSMAMHSAHFIRNGVGDQGPSPSPSPSPSVSASPTVTPSSSPTATPSPTTSPTTMTPTSAPTRTSTPTQTTGTGDLYVTPGYHFVNGRHWFTACEPYSQTVRCRTDILATQVTRVGDAYVSKTDWFFNNFTYLPQMTRTQWVGNPLGVTGSFTSSGRSWRTECDTPVTGRGGCRSYIMSSVVVAEQVRGGWTYKVETREVFNNRVLFRTP